MKLSIIEPGLSRRDFLAKTGKGTISILIGSGISPDVAKSIVDKAAHGDKFCIFRHIQSSTSAFYCDAAESANIAWNGLKAFKREFDLDPMFAFGPDQIGAGSIVNGNGLIDFFAKASNNGWEVIPEDENNWLLAKDDEEVTVSRHQPGDELDWSFHRFDSYNGFFKKWWSGWMESAFESSTPEFRRLLEKYGIDYWDRPDFVVEQAMEALAESDPIAFEKEFGSINRWLKLAEKYDIPKPKEYDIPQSKKYDVEEFNPTQDDYIYGSSMHQPFESKLNKALI